MAIRLHYSQRTGNMQLYKILKPHEIIEMGDQFFDGEWKPCQLGIGLKVQTITSQFEHITKIRRPYQQKAIEKISTSTNQQKESTVNIKSKISRKPADIKKASIINKPSLTQKKIQTPAKLKIEKKESPTKFITKLLVAGKNSDEEIRTKVTEKFGEETGDKYSISWTRCAINNKRIKTEGTKLPIVRLDRVDGKLIPHVAKAKQPKVEKKA